MFVKLWHNAWRDGLVSLSAFCTNQASVLLCSAYMTLTETGIYSISVQLTTAISGIAYTMYSSRQPAMQSAFLRGDRSEMRRSMAISVFALFLVSIVGTFALVTVGIPILKLIKPDKEFDVLVICALALYELLLKFQNCCASFISNTNHIPYMKAFVLSAIAGIGVSVILLSWFHMGIWGLILGQAIAQLVYNNWKWPHVVCENYLETSFGSLFVDGFQALKSEFKRK